MSIDVDLHDIESAQLEAELENLEQQIKDLLRKSADKNISQELEAEVRNLRARVDQLQEEMRARLSPMERVRNARHPDRPYTLDYVKLIFEDFQEIFGDRRYADDPAIVCGMAKF
jgi:acetyl-CoA carboxylase carboxyl transferase subunit alpha